MIIYNGESNYDVPTEIAGLFKDYKLGKQLFLDPHLVIELQKMDDTEHAHKLYSYMFENALKHSRTKDLFEFLHNKTARKGLYSISLEDILYFSAIFCYTLYSTEKEQQDVLELFQESVPDEIRSEVMNAAEQLIQKGIDQGELKKAEKIALAMLKQGYSIKDISGITEIEPYKIIDLQKKMK